MIKLISIQPECSVMLISLSANGFELKFLQTAAIFGGVFFSAFISVLQKEIWGVNFTWRAIFFSVLMELSGFDAGNSSHCQSKL